MKDLKKKGQYVIAKEYNRRNNETVYWLLRFQDYEETKYVYNYRFSVIDNSIDKYFNKDTRIHIYPHSYHYPRYYSYHIKSFKNEYINDYKYISRYYKYLNIENVPKNFYYMSEYEFLSVFPIDTTSEQANFAWRVFIASELKEETK